MHDTHVSGILLLWDNLYLQKFPVSALQILTLPHHHQFLLLFCTVWLAEMDGTSVHVWSRSGWLYPIYKQKLSRGTQQILTQQLLFHIVWFTGIVDIT
jgi:hypothetical protein